MAMCCITAEEPSVISPLVQVAVILHGILLMPEPFFVNLNTDFCLPLINEMYFVLGIMLSLPESCGKLQFSIAHLCEIW